MTTITIDFNSIITRHDLILIKKRVSPVPGTKSSLGLILTVPKEQLGHLESIPKGQRRVLYINSPEFIVSITGYVYISYDKKRNICEILRSENISVYELVNELLNVFPNDALVWVSMPIHSSSKIHKYVKSGFSNPHLSKRTPGGEEFSDYRLCLVKTNDINQYDIATVTNEVSYILAQIRNSTQPCQIMIRLTPDTVKYLQNLQNMGNTLNSNGAITQKEIAGNLVCTRVTKGQIRELSIDSKSLVTGREQSVPISPGLYNFHSHPKSAYTANKVKVGWPSAQDYVGFLLAFLEDDTIIHMVTSIEGLYTMSISKKWLLNRKRLDKSISVFILKNYNFCGVKNTTPSQYVRYVNKIKFKESPLFVVHFIHWHSAGRILTVDFMRDGGNCFTIDKTFKYNEQLYGKYV